MATTALDLFAGPGGWDAAARELGLDPLGIEHDDAACATREAAGLQTLQSDVAALAPLQVWTDYVNALRRADWQRAVDEGYGDPAAPPDELSRAECGLLIASPPCQAYSMAGKRAGENDKRHVIACAHELAAGNDTRSEYRAKCEDVRSLLVVEPLRYALALRPDRIALEQVPPVLELWSLFASLLQTVGYRTWVGVLSAERYGVPQTRKRAILLADCTGGPVHPPAPTHQAYVPGESAEEQHTLEGVLEPWVSMAEALGWDADCPAPTVTAGGTGGRHYRNGNQPNAAKRPVEEPAPTLHFGHALNSGVEWTTTPHEPWTSDRPATTVAGDPRVAQPGHKRDEANPDSPGRMQDAVRVTLEEAAILQGFPPDYPFQGTRTKRFEQVGNAVPPPLARAILAALLAIPAPLTNKDETAPPSSSLTAGNEAA